jgi:hypothetical protein
MDYQDYIPDAIELVDSWELDETDWRQAVINQARILAGMDSEPRADISIFSPYLALQF